MIGALVAIQQSGSVAGSMVPAQGRSVVLRSTLAVLVLLASVQAMPLESGAPELVGGEPSPVGLDEHARPGVGVGPGWVSDGASDTLRRAMSSVPFLAGLALAAKANAVGSLARRLVWRTRIRDIVTFDRLGSRGPPEFASLS